VKCDNCNRPGGYTEQQLFANFSRYLNATGRSMYFSLCEWGESNVQAWGADVGQGYRIQMDHLPLWELPTHAAGMGFGQGTYDIIEYIATLQPSTFIKQYGWMDPDFLMTLFWPTMTFTYSKTEFSFWALWSAPLIVSTNIYNMTDEKKSILMNAEVIAVDQDPLHTAGDRLANNSDKTEIWSRPMANGDKVVLLFNGNFFESKNVTVPWAMIGFGNTTHPATAAVVDVWLHQHLGNVTSSYTAVRIPPTDVVMLRVTCVTNC
jgi:alpha-galactosidase